MQVGHIVQSGGSYYKFDTYLDDILNLETWEDIKLGFTTVDDFLGDPQGNDERRIDYFKEFYTYFPYVVTEDKDVFLSYELIELIINQSGTLVIFYNCYKII